MKKLALTTFSVLLAFCSFSQAGFGLKIGSGAARVPNTGFDYKWRNAITGGLYYERALDERFFIQPELVYTLKGYSEQGIAGRNTVNYHYLNLPVMFGYHASRELAFQAGPEAGYLLADNYPPPPYPHAVEKFDLGLAGGVCWTLSEKLKIDLRYTQGVTKVYKAIVYDPITAQVSEEKKLGRNQVLMLSLYLRVGHSYDK